MSQRPCDRSRTTREGVIVQKGGDRATSLVLLFAASIVAAAAGHECFVDPVWGPDELYHDYNHNYGAAHNPVTNSTQELLMDFYAPPPDQDNRTMRPTVLLIRGGSFVSGG